MAINSGFDSGNSQLPIKVENVFTGSTGEIKRLTYKDNSTRILKTANEDSFNTAITDEYYVMAAFQELRTVPRVYDFNKPEPTRPASFTMEDLQGFVALNAESDGSQFINLLNTDEKTLFILFPVVKTLQEINSQGIVHNDVQLQNIMYRPDDGDIRLVDYGNARRTEKFNPLADVQQTQSMILSLYSSQSETVPQAILEWSQKSFSTSGEAWQDALRSIDVASNKQIDIAEARWRQIQPSLI